MLKTLEEIRKMSESGQGWSNGKGTPIAFNVAKPKNVAIVQKNLWEETQVKFLRESFRRTTAQLFGGSGFDLADLKKFPVLEDNFNWKAVAQRCGYPNVEIALKEANTGSNFAQVLRAGIQAIVNNMYDTVETTYDTWVTTVNSTKDTELYAPLHGISFLSEVGKQELYGESRAVGLDIKLRNRKYGVMFAVEKELLEDDQTGQFAKQASLLGEYCKQALEVIAYAKLAGKFTGGATAQYATLEIPNTETQPTDEANYPWSTALTGGGANRPSSFTILNQAGIIAGFIGLMNQKNKLGLKMGVNPRRLLIGPTQKFDAALLLNSSFYPSVPSSTAGATGGTFAINPIESIAALTVSRWMFKNDGTANGDSKAWYLIDDQKPWFVLQMRQACIVEQENPTAGESFNRDIVRFKCSTRANADHIDPRFAWQGNDGSVTS